MPELPEVETVIRSIESNILYKKINAIHVFWDKTLSTHKEQNLNKILYRKSISAITRRGKYIIIHLKNGYMVMHLRMTGKLIFQQKISENILPHLRFKINFVDNSSLNFTDIRKFGRIGFYKNLDFLNKKLGLEPFSTDLTIGYLINKFFRRTGPIKGALLNQSIIAGIGNIYADEILYSIQIHPKMPANKLNSKQLKNLIITTQQILQNAINSMGTTIINFSFNKGSIGNYGSQLKIFNKEGENCKRCSNIIIKTKCAGRGTFFCPSCQIL